MFFLFKQLCISFAIIDILTENLPQDRHIPLAYIMIFSRVFLLEDGKNMGMNETRLTLPAEYQDHNADYLKDGVKG